MNKNSAYRNVYFNLTDEDEKADYEYTQQHFRNFSSKIKSWIRYARLHAEHGEGAWLIPASEMASLSITAQEVTKLYENEVDAIRSIIG